MKQSRDTDEQVAFALKQAETGRPVAGVIAGWASRGRRSTVGRRYMAGWHGELRRQRTTKLLGAESRAVFGSLRSHRPDQTPLVMRVCDLAATLTLTRYGYFRIYILLHRER